MTEPDALRPDQLLCFNLYATSHAFTRAYKALLAPLGLTYPQYLVMLSLGARDGQTVGELGADVGLDSNTLSPLLKRLEAAGHVQRRRAGEDERRVQVHLTDTGRAIARDSQCLPARMGAATGLAPQDLRAMMDMLRRLRPALDAVAEGDADG